MLTLMLNVLFQSVFHHFFSLVVKDIGLHIGLAGAYSLEFEDKVPFCNIYLRFWREQELVSVKISRFGSGNPFPTGHLGSVARLLSAFSTQNNIVSCSGCPNSILKALDKSTLFEKFIQYPFRFDDQNLQSMIRRSDCTVFGRIDFYSVLQYLVVYLGGSQHLSWMSETTHLIQVTLVSCFPNS